MKSIKSNSFYLILILLLKINISNGECSKSEPFLRGSVCSSNYCTDEEFNGNSCSIDNSIIKIQWLNNIIVFDSANYRAGKFAIDANGNMVAEYSINNKRLFYGLKTDGSYYFNGNDIKIIDNIKSGEDALRYESNNIFVSLGDDISKTKQYLFSVSLTGDSVMELHDLENNAICIRSASNYLNVEGELRSFVIPLLEFKFNNINMYLMAFTFRNGNEFNLKTFYFQNFDLNGLINKSLKYHNYNIYSRILSAFTMNNCIILFFLNKDSNNENINKYVINIYDFELNLKKEKIQISSDTIFKDNYDDEGEGIFFKALYLKDIH